MSDTPKKRGVILPPPKPLGSLKKVDRYIPPVTVTAPAAEDSAVIPPPAPVAKPQPVVKTKEARPSKPRVSLLKRKGFRYSCLVLLLLIVSAMAVMSWLGTKRGVLTGKVTYQGETVKAGSVVLVGPDLRPITAAINEDGTYKFTNVHPGKVRLAVYGPPPSPWQGFFLFGGGPIQINGGKGLKVNGAEVKQLFGGGMQITRTEGKQGAKNVAVPVGNSKREPVVPESYSDFDLSGLQTTIRWWRPNTYEIEMK